MSMRTTKPSFLSEITSFSCSTGDKKSLPGYIINVKQTGDYEIVFSTDEKRFGGFENIDENAVFPSEKNGDAVTMKIYNVARTAAVYSVKK